MKGGYNAWDTAWSVNCDTTKCGGGARMSYTLCDSSGQCGGSSSGGI